MKAKKPLPRISKKRRAALGDRRIYSSITSKPKPIRKVNPKAKAKRTAGYRKMLSGKEYRSARAEAMERAGGRCEYRLWCAAYVAGDVVAMPARLVRCPQTEELHAHHLSYPKSRPLCADDLQIVCRHHHEYLESQKMHKTRMF